MNTSLKIGAISGLIAGIVGAILKLISIIVFSNVGLSYLEPLEKISKIASLEILIAIIWGIILGIVYSKVRQVMPVGTIIKGLTYGFLCLLIISIRDVFWLIQYYAFFMPQFHPSAYVIYNLTLWIPYGIVLSGLFENWYGKEKHEISKYDMKSGIQPGAIAGLIGGIVAFSSILLRDYILNRPSGPDMEFIMSMLGAHVFIHMFFGVIFGALFTKVYNLVPGKGTLKGLYYSLIILISATSYIVVFWITAGLVFENPAYSLWGSLYDVDYPALIVFGLVLGYLYRKTSE